MKLTHPLMAALLITLLAANAQAADKKHGAPQKSEPAAEPQKNEPAPEPKKSEPAAGSTWTEPKSGMEFVWIPTGCFQMGGDGGDETPVGKVCLKGFYLGKYEVTQAQYQAMTGGNPSKFKGSDRPVEQVSFQDIKNNIEEFNYQSGQKLRLPTEAEWEYACRAGGEHSEYCGAGSADKLGWYGEDYGRGSTHPVGQKRPNAWGLYDMSGNVWEWVEDCYHDSYNGAPSDGSAWKGGSCKERVVRGGSWYREAQSVRAAYRLSYFPVERSNFLGFRLARTLP